MSKLKAGASPSPHAFVSGVCAYCGADAHDTFSPVCIEGSNMPEGEKAECVATRSAEVTGVPSDIFMSATEAAALEKIMHGQSASSGVVPVPDVKQADIKADLLQEAGAIVNGARRSAYGTPENNFERIARFWQAYFDNTGRDVKITAEDVSPMMRLMKEARLCESPDHRDSFVDIIGYTLTGAEVNKVKTS